MPEYRVTVALVVRDDNGSGARGKVQVMLYQAAQGVRSNLWDDVRGYDVESTVTGGDT